MNLCYEDRRMPKDFKDTTEAGESLITTIITTIIPIITAFYKDMGIYCNWFSYKSQELVSSNRGNKCVFSNVSQVMI